MGLPINLLWTNNELNLPMPKKRLDVDVNKCNYYKNFVLYYLLASNDK